MFTIKKTYLHVLILRLVYEPLKGRTNSDVVLTMIFELGNWGRVNVVNLRDKKYLMHSSQMNLDFDF